jgi:hypothetical protein
MAGGHQEKWRLELFYSSEHELVQAASFISTHGIKHVNLTNKNDRDTLVADVAVLKQHVPDIDVCAHFSIKYNYHRDPDVCLQRIRSFLDGVNAELPEASHVLLVSGGGKKRRFDTVTALEALQSRGSSHADPALNLAIAYNPYLPDPAARKEELSRLQRKLATGLVSRVYLQMGSDLPLLRHHLGALQAEFARLRAVGAEVPRVYGSVFLPSKQLLARMRFRPWSGVFLSEGYLGSVEGAERVTRELLAVYREHGVVPLVESRVQKGCDLQYMLGLLGESADEQEG